MLSSSFQEITSLTSPSTFLTSHPLYTGFAQGSNLIPLFTLRVLTDAFLLLWHQFRFIYTAFKFLDHLVIPMYLSRISCYLICTTSELATPDYFSLLLRTEPMYFQIFWGSGLLHVFSPRASLLSPVYLQPSGLGSKRAFSEGPGTLCVTNFRILSRCEKNLFGCLVIYCNSPPQASPSCDRSPLEVKILGLMICSQCICVKRINSVF